MVQAIENIYIFFYCSNIYLEQDLYQLPINTTGSVLSLLTRSKPRYFWQLAVKHCYYSAMLSNNSLSQRICLRFHEYNKPFDACLIMD